MKRITLPLFLGFTGCPGFGSQTLGNGLITEVPACPTYEEHLSLLMDTYCVSCHGDVSISPDVSFQFNRYDGPNGVFENAEAILQACESTRDPMPPIGLTPLDSIELDTLAVWIEQGKLENRSDCGAEQ